MGGSSNVSFSIKTAYHFLKNDVDYRKDWEWNCIWHIDVILWVQILCWLMVQESFLTNVSKMRKCLSDDSNCYICNHGIEDLIYVIINCRRAKVIWLSLGALDKDKYVFFLHDWKSCMSSNLKSQKYSLGFDGYAKVH